MHYVPESAQEFLQKDSSQSGDSDKESNFHYQSAPIYFLTLIVGLLLLADILIGQLDIPAWKPWQSLFGFRLSLLAAIIGGSRILYQTLEGLFEGKVGAGLALTIATLAAIILGENETAALVVFIALCGESIEGYTIDRAQYAIRRIFELCPRLAHVVRQGKEIDIPVEEVIVDEIILIRPGERIPVDGLIESGSTSIDQSSLTGESLPVDKSKGDPVYAGTLNQEGSLRIKAVKVGEETTLSQIVRLVSEATLKKAPLERTADRLARLFLPAVLLIALITLLAWRWQTGSWQAGFLPMLGVLVVACPCPLILATPTAVMAAMAWLARTGIVVKGSIALERLASVDSIVFDKTGTLTEGKPTLGQIHPLVDIDEKELLRITAIAEKRSEHVLSRLIVREAEKRGMVIPNMEEMTAFPGQGIMARIRTTVIGPVLDHLAINPTEEINGENYYEVTVGNRRFLESREIPVDNHSSDSNDFSGQTVLYVAAGKTVLGLISVTDIPREEAFSVIQELRSLGIRKFSLLTGDQKDSVEKTLSSLLPFFEEVHAEMFPADKAKWIEKEIRNNRRVTMIGDGINDAPALATSTVGIALAGVGSELAAEAGDLLLMGDPLKPLPSLLRLSRQFVNNIKQSIYFFAFGMNILGILLCATGILSPVAGAIFHEVSSFAVMINAMRLLWFDRKDETGLGRFASSVNRMAETLTTLLSPSRIIYRVIKYRSEMIRILAGAAVIFWMLSNIVQVAPDEQAIVSRFGKQDRILSPGTYWCYPAPIETVQKEKVNQIRSIKIGFRGQGPENMLFTGEVSPVEWTSEHRNDQRINIQEESNLMTSDEVSVELTADVQYEIDDLGKFLFDTQDPVSILRSVTENAIRSVVIDYPLDDLLTDDREQIRKKAFSKARESLKEYDTGLSIVELDFLDVHPPLPVVPAYRDIANALEQKEQFLNESNAYLISRLYEAAGEKVINSLIPDLSRPNLPEDQQFLMDEAGWKKVTQLDANGNSNISGESAVLLNQAREKSQQMILGSKGNVSRFDSLLSVYQNKPDLTQFYFYWNTVEKVLENRTLTIIDPISSNKPSLWMNNLLPEISKQKSLTETITEINPSNQNGSELNDSTTPQ